MQRLALFDLDNTLIDLDAAFRVWIVEFADQHRLPHGATDWLVSLDRDGLPHREEFFAKVRGEFGLPEPVDVLWGAYRRRMPHLVRCRTEVLNGLVRLRGAGWKVGIVTNGTADNQLGKIQRTGLIDVVDAYALSGLEGVRKPERGLFEIAARRCGASLEEGGWMVGDRLDADITGGRAAGLRTIWINRDGSASEHKEADHVVTDVVRAMEILRES
ncbi:HAD-IA family hydrolase [Nonomuraea sp. NPDC049152]|uniref:HAD family hydrolase n=1 Tax=Nonomuraea sp. NPDC049152 TaxID=3154350 RepID=UPI0033C67A7F